MNGNFLRQGEMWYRKRRRFWHFLSRPLNTTRRTDRRKFLTLYRDLVLCGRLLKTRVSCLLLRSLRHMRLDVLSEVIFAVEAFSAFDTDLHEWRNRINLLNDDCDEQLKRSAPHELPKFMRMFTSLLLPLWMTAWRFRCSFRLKPFRHTGQT